MIYFIRSPEGPIKIGTTVQLSQRLKQLVAEYGEGLEVLAVIDGSFDVEKSLHRQFAHLRRVGEWFEPGDDLLAFIVNDGKPWDGIDEKADVAVKFDRVLADKLRIIVQRRGGTMSGYLSELVRSQIEKEYLKVVREMANEVEGEE